MSLTEETNTRPPIEAEMEADIAKFEEMLADIMRVVSKRTCSVSSGSTTAFTASDKAAPTRWSESRSLMGL